PSPTIMSSSFLPPLTIPPSGTHTHTLIFLHGRGDRASIFGPIFTSDLFDTASFPSLKLIFPTPAEKFSRLYNRRLRQWFYFSHKTPRGEYSPQLVEGLKEVVEYVGGLIDTEEKEGVEVLLGGLSQGCAVAVMAMLAGGRKVKGVVGMSGWMPFVGELGEGLEGVRRLREVLGMPPLGEEEVRGVLETPVWLGHGDADEVVEYEVGREMCVALEKLGMTVRWKRYSGLRHWYQTPEEIEDVVKFWAEMCGLLAGERRIGAGR
ncbi:Alpha/Beta hydrolase protein, partial [Trichophaea hybrida]